MANLTPQEINDLNRMNQTTTNVGLGTRINNLELSLPAVGTPVNAVKATKTLTIAGVVLDGETFTINNPAVTGTDKYEFLADVAQTKTEATNIAVNIAANVTKAVVTLTVDTQPIANDTMTIGNKVYTFVALAGDTEDGKISVGADLAAAKLNIVAAINGSGFNVAHPLVSAAAFVADACAITALVGGTLGNAINSVETFTAVTNIFSAVTLTTGANCSAANAITALVAAITASDTQGVGAVDGAGDTVVFTADAGGLAGNAIILAETLTNGSLAGGATTLAGGLNGTVGKFGKALIDATYIYYVTADNTVAGQNWRRIALGAAF